MIDFMKPLKIGVGALLALTLAACSMPQEKEVAQNKPLPAGVHQGTVKQAIGELKVAPEENAPGYSRKKFHLYSDLDGNGCDARVDVLRAEATKKPEVSSGCSLKGAEWTSWYDGKRAVDPSRVTIDHVVPLAEAWRSGASEWGKSALVGFANDTEYAPTLTAVSPESNSAKGDKDPANWVPPNKGALCTYVASWVAVKLHFDLNADPSEVAALKRYKDCQTLTTEWKDSKA